MMPVIIDIKIRIHNIPCARLYLSDRGCMPAEHTETFEKKNINHLYFYLKISRPWTAAKKVLYDIMYKLLECSQCGTNTIY